MKIAPPKARDLRLDFFRGLSLLIIFVAHVPNNWLALYKPGCFGFSDSADIFVFVSGCTSAFAYGGTFLRAGFLGGTARIVKRCAQLYGCHLGLFFTLAMLCVAGNFRLNTSEDYIGLLNLGFFFDHTEEALVGLFTLRYVPNYFDILPMYMVVLAMFPLVMLLARLHAALAVLSSVSLYIAVPVFGLGLPAEIAFDRPWFFNPFAWQFLFYTGFFFGAGWIKAPSSRTWLIALCSLYVIASIPLSHVPTFTRIPWLNALRAYLEPFVAKTDLGILRWLHFLCLAYLAVALFEGRERMLHSRPAAPIVKTGQQSLPVFVTDMAMAYLAGMALDIWGRTTWSVWVVNAVGIAMLVATAYLISWFKSEPWKCVRRALRPAEESPAADRDIGESVRTVRLRR